MSLLPGYLKNGTIVFRIFLVARVKKHDWNIREKKAWNETAMANISNMTDDDRIG
jgi:hypothetical protein